MGATAALGNAIAWTRRHWRLLVGIWILHVVVAWLLAAPLGAALAPVMDERPAASRMLDDGDGLAGELLSDHPELGPVGAHAADAGVVIWGLFYWLLAGGVLSYAARNDAAPRGLGPFLGDAGAEAGRMIRVGAWGLLLRLLPIGAAAGTWFALRPLSRGGGFGVLAGNALAAALAFALLWSIESVALDYARAIAVAEPARRARSCVASGLKLLYHRSGASALLVLFSGGGFLVVTALYHLACHPIPSAHFGGFLAVTLLRLAADLARVAITLVGLVACGRLAAARA